MTSATDVKCEHANDDVSSGHIDDFIGLILVRVPREEPRTMRRWIHDQFCKNTTSAPDIHGIVVLSLAQ